MCVIYYAKKKVTLLERASLAEAASRNADGVGAMWIDGGEIRVVRALKSADYPDVVKALPEEGPIALHFRYGTSGGVRMENVHPFLAHGGKVALMHNGVVGGWGEGERSDTRHIVEDVLQHVAPAALPSVVGTLFRGSRILMVAPNTDGALTWFRLGTWPEETGNWSEGTCDFAASALVKPVTSYWDDGEVFPSRRGEMFFTPQATYRGETHHGVPTWSPRRSSAGFAQYEAWRDTQGTRTIHWQAYLCRQNRAMTFAQWWQTAKDVPIVAHQADVERFVASRPSLAAQDERWFEDLPGDGTKPVKHVKPASKAREDAAAKAQRELEEALRDAPWRKGALAWCKAARTSWSTVAGVIEALDKEVEELRAKLSEVTEALNAFLPPEDKQPTDQHDDDYPRLGAREDSIPLWD